MRNEKFHKSLHNEFIPTIEETIKMIEMWLSFKNSQPCPNAPDKTIVELNTKTFYLLVICPLFRIQFIKFKSLYIIG